MDSVTSEAQVWAQALDAVPFDRDYPASARRLAADADRYSRDYLAQWVPLHWVSCTETTLGREGWVSLFRAAGYSVNGRPARLPSGPLRLYRGADWHRTDGLSWTTSLGVARKFATSDGQRSEAERLWTAEVPPVHLLARWEGRHEAEVVADVPPALVEPYAIAGADVLRPAYRDPWAAPEHTSRRDALLSGW